MSDKVDSDNNALEQGISSLLGKTPYAKPTKVADVCEHLTDGFVEDESKLHIYFTCIKCGALYKVLKTEME